MEIFEWIKFIASAISSGLVIVGFLATCLKPVRKKLADWVKKTCHSEETTTAIEELKEKMSELKDDSDKKDEEIKGSVKELADLMKEHIAKDKEKIEEHKKLEKSDRTIIRSEITTIYYRYCEKKIIPVYEKENFIYLYNQYKSLGGNSYVDDIKAQIDTWQILYEIPNN